MRFFVFIGLVLISSLGCARKSVPLSISSSDSIRIDTVIKTDTVYYIDDLFIKSLFDCDSLGNIQRSNLDKWSVKFDSLKKVSPITRTVIKIKKEAIFINKKEYIKSPVQMVEKKIIHPITYIAFIFGILSIILLIIVIIKKR